MPLRKVGGSLLKVGGSITTNEDCCCDPPASCCCALFATAESLDVTLGGAVSGTGTALIESADIGYCVQYRGEIIVTGCGGDITTITIVLRCPSTNTGAADLEIEINGDGAACVVGDVVIDSATCGPPFSISGTATVGEGTGCSCVGQEITWSIDEP